MTIQLIHTPTAPTPAGHYSQAVVHAGLAYVAGQLAIDPATGEHRKETLREEAGQVLTNLRAILDAAGSSMDRVLKVTVYVTDIALWGELNEVYAEHFGDHRPARAVVPVRDLHHGFRVELEAIAAVGS